MQHARNVPLQLKDARHHTTQLKLTSLKVRVKTVTHWSW